MILCLEQLLNNPDFSDSLCFSIRLYPFLFIKASIFLLSGLFCTLAMILFSQPGTGKVYICWFYNANILNINELNK